MGIADLNDLIREHAPNAIFTASMNDIRGKRVAIDACRWIYANWSMIVKREVMRSNPLETPLNDHNLARYLYRQALNYILRWLRYQITPIFVFEGASRPEKQETKNKRSTKKEDAQARITALEQQYQMQPNPAFVEEARKLYLGLNDIPYWVTDMLHVLLQGIGIPTLKATVDAEQLCASLAIEGHILATVTTDTDTLTFGCPFVITAVQEETLTFMRLDVILQNFGLSQAQFVDLCISLGCDFNNRIRNIGKVRCYNLIHQHGNIDNYPMDVTVLNHHRCRQIFAYHSSMTILSEILEPPLYNLQPHNISAIRWPCILDINKCALERAKFYFYLVGIDENEFLPTFQASYQAFL
jgi:flap endonuclease-1